MKDEIKFLKKELVSEFIDTSVYNVNVKINKKPLTITAEKHNREWHIPPYKWEITDKNQNLSTEIKEKIIFDLIEDTEDVKFQNNLKIHNSEINSAKELITNVYDKGNNLESSNFITIKELGENYSKKLANIMFYVGYANRVLNRTNSLEDMKKQLLDVLDKDTELNVTLFNDKDSITKEQLLRQIKDDFIENEIDYYLGDNEVDPQKVPKDFKEEMINRVRKGMIDDLSYKYVIWDTGDIEELIEMLPDECFTENSEQDEEEDEL